MTDERDWEPGALLDIYKVAVDEYRFQVSLNWSRTQYLFVLTAGILAVGAGLLNVDSGGQPWLVGAIFLLGLCTAVHAIAVTASQHSYYRATRNRMREVGSSIGLPAQYLLATTPGMKGEEAKRKGIEKLGRVTWMHYLLFGLLALLHTLAAAYVFFG